MIMTLRCVLAEAAAATAATEPPVSALIGAGSTGAPWCKFSKLSARYITT